MNKLKQYRKLAEILRINHLDHIGEAERDFAVCITNGELLDCIEAILDLLNRIEIAEKTLERVAMNIDHLRSLECTASVYYMDDDDFSCMTFVGDIAEEALAKIRGEG